MQAEGEMREIEKETLKIEKIDRLRAFVRSGSQVTSRIINLKKTVEL